MDKIKKIYTSEIKQIGDPENRILRFSTSTESEDRDGDVIKLTGWKLDNYLKNPVILYGHDYKGLPVGRSVNTFVDATAGKLIQDVEFATKEDYPFADTVYRLAKAGFLNATSVGFMGLKSEPRFNEKGEYIGKTFLEQELLETSIVPVPSNPTALQEARSKGIINEEELKEIESLMESKDPAKKTTLETTVTMELSPEFKEAFSELGDAIKGYKEALSNIEIQVKEYKKEVDELLEIMKQQIKNNENPDEIDIDSIAMPQKDIAIPAVDITPEQIKELVGQILSEHLKRG